MAEEDESKKKTIKRSDGEFVVALAKGGKSATVTDDKGFIVTIRYANGARPFEVRTPTNWGAWKSTMESAVDYAITLCVQARTYLKPGEFSQRLADYVNC